ncbi:MAG: FkbM family methyltransferase [Opitutaceae bacterium]|nr:FkbM family methyltransferase [Opitutaceae bacterium]
MAPEELRPVELDAYLAQPSEAEREFRRLFSPALPLVIFDIGACEGEDSVRYSRIYPRARILAFEPLPANQTLVRANFSRYSTVQAELVPVALSDHEGDAVFHVSSGRPADPFAGENWNYGNKSSSLLAPASPSPMHGWINFKESIVVRTTTLDSFCASRNLRHIDFIQMDVQGAERLVLDGASAMLPRIGAIWLEVANRELYRGQSLDREIMRFMRSHGFALAFETYRDASTGEGDHLYVNLRHPRSWIYLAGRGCSALLRRMRSVARRVLQPKNK